MSYSTATLKIEGYRGKQVPNTFRRQKGNAEHVAIVLPGRGYSCDMPLLYYPSELLLGRGGDVLAVEYAYFSDPDFREVSEAERALWIGADVTAAVQAALAQRRYKQITLIAKSLGTLALAHLVASEPALAGARAVWLTPLLGSVTLREQIVRWGGRSLFVTGTDDEAYDEAHLEEVRRATNGQALALQGADHSLEIEGDIWRSLELLQQVLRAVEGFLQ